MILESRTPQIGWDLPKQYLHYGLFAYIDLALISSLFEKKELTEEAALFLTFIARASRAGHLCVKVTAQAIEPQPEALFEWKVDQTLQKEILTKLDEQLRLGSRSFPSVHSVVVCEGQAYYLQKFWAAENGLIKAFTDYVNQVPAFALASDVFEKVLEKKYSQGVLNERQWQAIAGLQQQCLTIVTGGPGTGKTYTAGQLIDVLLESLSQEQKNAFKLGFAAPTGKAAANLQNSLIKAIRDPVIKSKVVVSTLHSLLKVKPQEYQVERVRLSYDLLIVDEASMIDFKLMTRLFAALKKGSRLVLLGDRYQLPPIEAGSPFGDVIDVLKRSSFPPVELEQCLRAELKDLIDFASEIKKGCLEGCLRYQQSEAIAWQHLPDQSDDLRKTLLKQLKGAFDQKNPEALLHSLKTFRILCALRQGPFGVDALNAYFYEVLGRNRASLHPIMIISNDARLNLFNGEMGVIDGSFAYFFEGDQTTIRKIPAMVLPRFEWAYCLSVHKSQGSEFDHVALIIPEGSHVFGREMLYTAVTRTRQRLEIWTKEHIFRKMLLQESQRVSCVLSKISSNSKMF